MKVYLYSVIARLCEAISERLIILLRRNKPKIQNLKIASSLRLFAMTIFLFALLFFPSKTFAQERIKLIKTQGNPAVYFVDQRNIRHVFPNREVYESWYGSDFSSIVTVSEDYLASLRLGNNVPWKPGKALLNVPSSTVVYAVEPGAVLRSIKDEATAKTVFGNEWYRKIRALPEIFFQNYTMGKPIANPNDVPDGWVVAEDVDGSRGVLQYAPTEKRYYIKWRGVLQEFGSVEALEKNGYRIADAFSTDLNYFSTRSSVIQSSVDRFRDPLFSPNISSLSCDMSSLKLGIVTVTDRSLSQGEIGVLYDSIFQLPKYYSNSTDGLGSVHPENNVVVMNFQKAFDDKEHSTLRFEEITQAYYDVHEDDIDFLAVFHTVYNHRQQENEIARYIPVSNVIAGMGKLPFDRANQFGSMGRLKGVLDMGNITQYAGDVGKGPNLTLGTLVHEMLHSVSGSVMILDSSVNTSDILLGEKDPFHWSRFLLETSFLGGDGWAAEGGGRLGGVQDETRGIGIFRSAVSSDPEFRRKFSNLDLYAFGFIPARSVGPIQYLDVSDRSNPTHRVEGVVRAVNMDQVIAANGKRECGLN